MVEVLGDRDATADAVARVNGEADVALAVDHGQTRIVTTADLLVVQIKTRLGLDLPVHTIVAVGQTHVGRCRMHRIRPLAVVVAKHHHIAALILGHAGIEDQRRIVWHVLGRQNRVLRTTDDLVVAAQVTHGSVGHGHNSFS